MKVKVFLFINRLCSSNIIPNLNFVIANKYGANNAVNSKFNKGRKCLLVAINGHFTGMCNMSAYLPRS